MHFCHWHVSVASQLWHAKPAFVELRVSYWDLSPRDTTYHNCNRVTQGSSRAETMCIHDLQSQLTLVVLSTSVITRLTSAFQDLQHYLKAVNPEMQKSVV